MGGLWPNAREVQTEEENMAPLYNLMRLEEDKMMRSFAFWAHCAQRASFLLPCLGYLGCDSSPPEFTDRAAEVFKDQAGLDPLSDDATAKSNDEGNGRGDQQGAGKPGSLRWKFSSTDKAEGDIEVDVETQIVDQRFSLQQMLTEAEKTFTQINRPMRVEVFEQGSESDFKKESFSQDNAPSGLLDIVVVVDNSGSMKEEQQNLSTKLMPLLSYVSESDWRIGVVTTDPRDGCLRGLIGKQDQNPELAFARAVTAGTGGTRVEQGIYQAVAGIKGECQGVTPWVRPNSTLAVLFLTDEDNCSDGKSCGDDSWSSANYLTDYLSSIRQIGVNARVYGLLWHPNTEFSACSTALRRGSIYAEAIARTGGAWGSICDDDYTATLQSISQDLSVILKTQFALAFTPNLDAGFELKVNGIVQRSGYRVTGNVLEFTTPPPANAKIDVAYYVTTKLPQASFSLSQKAVEQSLEVYVDGQKVSDFSYDASKKTVNFPSAPVGREVKISFRQDQPLPSSFDLGPNVEPRNILVRVNDKGLDQSFFSYVASSGKLEFIKAPEDGADIYVAYDIIEGPQLSYQAFVPEVAIDSIVIRDAKTGSPLNVRIQDRMLHFLPKDWSLDRELVLSYTNPYRSIDMIDIGFAILDDSLIVQGEWSGQCDKSRYDLSGQVVDFSDCGFSGGESVYLSFDYISRHQTSFNLPLGQGVKMSGNDRLRVLVNGQEYADYQLEANKIVFQDLDYFSEILVELDIGSDD